MGLYMRYQCRSVLKINSLDRVHLTINGVEKEYQIVEHSYTNDWNSGPVHEYRMFELEKLDPKSKEQLAAEEAVKKCEEALANLL